MFVGIEGDTLQAFLGSIILEICAPEDPATFLQNLGANKSSVCGVVWKPKQPCYKCLTCELDPTWYDRGGGNIVDRWNKHDDIKCYIGKRDACMIANFSVVLFVWNVF